MFDYTAYLDEFLIKIGVPFVSRENINHIYSCISNTDEKKQKIFDIISQYKTIDFDYKKVLKDFEDFALPRLRNKCEVDVLCLCLLARQLEIVYNQNNLPQDIYLATVKDFAYKINECELVKKLSGIFCAEFYEDMFKLKMFKLGRLEYQIRDNIFDIAQISDVDKVLSIHIPKTGTSISADVVDESLKMAKDFFKNYYGFKKIVFICDSWILFPENRNIVGPNSNIVKFADRFTIFKTYNLDGYSELWRIFDREFNGLKSLKDDTSLRRGYRKLVEEGKPIGRSAGYLIG